MEPRFRGQQVVSPLESSGDSSSYFTARVNQTTETAVHFSALGESNPNNFTPNTQGMCLDVEMPATGDVYAVIGGRRWQWPLAALLAGARSDLTGGIESPALRIHQAPLPHQWHWKCHCDDQGDGDDFYYVRVRQTNDQWAWSSPIWIRR